MKYALVILTLSAASSKPLDTCEAGVAPLLLAAGGFRFAMFSAKQGIVEAANFVRCLGLYARNLLPPAVFVDRDEDEVGAGNVEVRAGLRIFDPDLYADFKRGVEGAIDAGFEDEQIADVYGLDEVDMIHGRGHYV